MPQNGRGFKVCLVNEIYGCSGEFFGILSLVQYETAFPGLVSAKKGTVHAAAR